jgi:ferredoxin-NADP reductase
MARTALPRRLTWQQGRVTELVQETPRTKSISLELPHALGHRAGQHVDVRLTAEDGYQAQRSYSIGSAPEDPALVLTVERLDDGEVSPYLTDELRPGDELELRGPIGGYFVWEEALGGPVELIAGGSGIVPLHAILRHWAAGSRSASIRLLYSARSLTDVIYRDELDQLAADTPADVQLTLTREWPDDWKGLHGRVDRELLARVVATPKEAPLVYICGPTPFVEAVAEALVGIGHDPKRIRTERFGPTGS